MQLDTQKPSVKQAIAFAKFFYGAIGVIALWATSFLLMHRLGEHIFPVEKSEMLISTVLTASSFFAWAMWTLEGDTDHWLWRLAACLGGGYAVWAAMAIGWLLTSSALMTFVAGLLAIPAYVVWLAHKVNLKGPLWDEPITSDNPKPQ